MTDEQIFDQVVQLPVGERAAFLGTRCNNEPEQRRRIEALIAAYEQSDSLLDTDAMASVDATVTERPPRKTLGDFEIIRELGRGGMGVVYEARQKSLKRKVAFKVLSSGLGLSSKAILRFRREAEAAGKLHHTNIVPIYTTGEDHGVHFYAMELIDGPSLDAVIRVLRSESKIDENDRQSVEGGELPAWVKETALFNGPEPATPVQVTATTHSTPGTQMTQSSIASGSRYFDQVATMIADVADALDHAHEHGVIHRDIKPSNLLLGPDGRLSINDFGLARMLEQPGMTMSGEFVGSPLYMSPEQITAGRVSLDHRTDIYSLGATLYELLALQPPFPGQTRDQVLSQILHKDAVSTRRSNRRIPVDLDTICMKAIDKDPDRRYQTAGQLADDLRKFVNRHAISARRIGPIGRAARWVKRRPSQAALILFVTVVAIAAAANHHSDKVKTLNHAKEMHLVYCMSGNFEAASRQMQLAEASGATGGWLLFAEGQTELYRGNYDHAFKLLDEASKNGGPPIPTRAIKAIARLYSGDERNHVLDLQYISRALSEGDLVPESPEDSLYLAMAFQYADPKASLAYLAKADQGIASGRLHDVVRCVANMYAAASEMSLQSAIDYAESARSAAESMRGVLDESPLAVCAAIEAETVAGICFQRANETERSERAFARARELTRFVDRFPQSGGFHMSVYLLLDETEQDDMVSQYLKKLPANRIDHYTRTYRMIDCFRLGDLGEASRDMKGFKRDHDFKYPFVVLTRLSGNPNENERNSIQQDFRAQLRHVLGDSAGDVFHIEFFWAACRLLGMNEEARKCEREIEARAATYSGTYIGDTMQPIAELTARVAAPEILENAAMRSRRSLTYAFFALGIETLARGQKDGAREYFERCARDGVNGFYVCQMSRALTAKLATDPDWPEWIESTKPRD